MKVVHTSAALLLLLLSSCRSGTPVPDQTGTGEVEGYQLLWADYFDSGSLDADKWICEVDGKGGGNAELQYYLPDNVSVIRDPADGRGCLRIEARREACGGKQFTSGRLSTEGKFEFTYGKVEASIKLPSTADGLWPAFWLLGADIRTNLWPACGEIDILEMGNAQGIADGTQDRYFNGACHWGRYVEGWHPDFVAHHLAPYSLQDDEYHLYTLIWEKDRITMFLDKDRFPEAEPYLTLDISPSEEELSAGKYFHHNHFILLNLAVGGIFTGILDPSGISALNNAPAVMLVDFVKVYQRP